MTAIIISQRRSDSAEAHALKDCHEELFPDFDPGDGIPAGVDREQRLDQELRRCHALLIGAGACLESGCCGNEFDLAREKGRAVFVARVGPCAGGPLIPALREVDNVVYAQRRD
jgi:hypothetical protein